MGTRAGRLVARHAGAWALTLLAACVDPTQPPYVQTPGSVAAFALFERVQAGERGDLPAKARTAELVEAGVCHEVGAGRLYCNALRLTEAENYPYYDFGPDFDLQYDELRFCLAPGRAVGFLSEGSSGAIPIPLYREYPEEFASVMGSPGVQLQPEPRFAETALLFPDASLTDLSVNAALRRLGYGGPGSRFEQATSGRYSAQDYPSHAEGRRACQGL